MPTGQLDNQLFGLFYRFGGLARGRVYFDRAPIPCKREVSATSGPRFNTERKTIISSPAAAGEFDATEEAEDGGAQLSLREFDVTLPAQRAWSSGGL